MKTPQTVIAKMPPHVIARNEAHRSCAEGVMLRYSKHEGNGLSAPILREPQDDSALFITPTVIARNEAHLSCAEGVMLRYSKHEGNGLCAPILREPQDDSALWLIVAFVFCLLPSLNALAQSKDTVHLQFHDDRSLSPLNRPLIVLDGIPYSGIPNPDDIKQITLLEGKEATALFGSQAALGVIWVTTKNFKGYYKINNPDRTEDLYIDTNALYIIDGKVSSNKLNGIDVQNILSVNILKYTAQDPSLNKGIKSEVLIITKFYAVQQNQKKFSDLSKSYKDYIQLHRDSDILYVLNGVQMLSTSNETIRKLYELPVKKIKSVGFLDNYKLSGIARPVIIITTKQ